MLILVQYFVYGYRIYTGTDIFWATLHTFVHLDYFTMRAEPLRQVSVHKRITDFAKQNVHTAPMLYASGYRLIFKALY